MSGGELDRIQNQLKVAVMSHQMLVISMKTDAQNPDVEIQLHELQSQIRVLSEKQKLVVQQLRKEILSKSIEGQPNSDSTATVKVVAEDLVTEPISTLSSDESIPTDLSVNVCVGHPSEGVSVGCRVSSGVELSVDNYVRTSGEGRGAACDTQVGCVTELATEAPPGHEIQRERDTVASLLHSTATGSDAGSTSDTCALSPIIVASIAVGESINKRSLSSSRATAAGGGLVPSMKSNELSAGIVGSSVKTTSLAFHQQHRVPFTSSSSQKSSLTLEERKKLEFMSMLGLVTPDSLKELQSKRTERKRKSTLSNPQFIYDHEPIEAEVREDCCTVCHRSGELLMCDECSLVYHLQCLDPPLVNVPQGFWSCQKCPSSVWKQSSGKEDCSAGTLASVFTFLTQKAAKEEKKKNLQKRVEELVTEKLKLQEKSKLLSQAIMQEKGRRTDLEERTTSTQNTVKKLRNFVEMFSTIV